MKKKITFLERKRPGGCWSVALTLCLGLSAVLPGEADAYGAKLRRENALAGERTYKAVRSTLNAAENERAISGKVTEGAGKEGLVGVNILIKGTSRGTVTDATGKYVLRVDSEKDTLVFSFLGFISQEMAVGNRTVIDIALTANQRQLNEVVVTALGIKKEKKAVGYSVSEVKGATMVKAREPNAISSLTGKVAGLTIAQSPDLLSSPQVTLRGRDRVLYVVDGVPMNTDSWNLSPDDIETYSVLKGASAAALYGNRGQNGAIIITTKKGSGAKKGFTVDFNSSTQLQTGFNAIPKYQSEYGPGSDYEYAFKDGRGGGINDNDYNIWGPRFEGQLITQYNSPKDPKTGELVPIPWLARGKNNLTNFLRNGLLSTNNLAISSKNEFGDFRLSLSQTFQRGQMPNTKLGGTNVNISGGINAGKKMRFDASINYNRQYSPNYPTLDYGPASPIYIFTVWGGVDYDVNDLRNYWQPGKENAQQYNREYTIYDNPWMTAYEALKTYYKNDVYGFAQMNYKISDKLTFNARTNVSTWNRNRSTRAPISSNLYNFGFPNQAGGYSETYDTFWENNTEASLKYENRFGKDFGLNASLYGNLRSVKVTSLTGKTTKGLLVPGVYDLSNSVQPSTSTNDYAKRWVGSVYGFVDMEYKDFLFLSLTGRADRSSTMPKKNNTYFYPSASLSAVLSEVIDLPQAISFAKVRGAYANVASDFVDENLQYDIYKLLPTYTSSAPWNNSYTGVSYTGTLYSDNLQAARVKTFELGLEMRFLHNRLGFDAAVFRNVEGPGIVSVPTSITSGVSGVQRNAFTYVRKGIELGVDGTVVKNENLTWNVSANWSLNHKWLDKIDGVQQRDGNIHVGERQDAYYIKDFQRDEAGNIIVGSNGMPAYNPYNSKIGYYDNKFTAGINNTFTHKSFTLSFQVDGRFGGKVNNYMYTKQFGSGTAPESANEYRLKDWQNRDNPDYKGSVMTSGKRIVKGQLNTDQDGNVISDTREFTDNNVPVLWQAWATNYYQSGYIAAKNRTYVKLREVVLTYNFPAKLLSKTHFASAASLSLVGRNLLYFTGKYTKNIDLDQFTGTTTSFQTPSVKSFGANLNVTF
ncbi:SusC/RagA family TonB-linked outer membrane protein [Dyadobacter jiangsuensis]|uniref:TonB-linked SusC/RagA family outer membrane protein n=1 Tax=Dyadobacter jiangsuensis TaxID=1591085 RepID=A0A2P8FMS5_9BACT|nr:SusC/RagA family TonB-linked outer membrane protein [Dyadobacter jiangsuensis]PSL22955.1 TonB-linked SusC/RagA family outer membrane protein [Dyadobacter jiangsuensis]